MKTTCLPPLRTMRWQLPTHSNKFRQFHSSCALRASSPLSDPATVRSASSVNPPVSSTPPLGYPPSWLRRNRGLLLWSVLGLSLGIVAGNTAVNVICAPPLPAIGTPEDIALLADLNRRIDDEFKVKVLRGKCLGVSKALKGGEGGWVEIVPRPGPTRDEVLRKSESLIDTLQGARGLGAERIFWDRDEEKLVAVIWFGGALSGWPNVTHGGVIATQLAEKLGLAAMLSEEKHHGRRRTRNKDQQQQQQQHESESESVSAATPQRMPGTGTHAKMYAPETTPGEPAQLTLSYVKPTFANNFYVIRVGHALDLQRDPAHIVPDEPASGRHDYEATLETMDSRIQVKAKAKFAPSSLLDRVEHKVVDSTKQTYSEFKQWLWPSRQDTSRS